jgi:hypothetical protein
VDRQKVKSRSEYRMYRVADRLVVKAGRMVRQEGTKFREEARVKTVRTRTRRIAKGAREKHAG